MSAARRLVSSSCLEVVHELASGLGIDREASGTDINPTYSSPMTSLVLTDSSQLTSDCQHLEDLTKSVSHLGKVQQNLLQYNASISSYIKELKDARNVTLALSDEKTSTN
uniref:Uncharacterized protein n=1 Tax=Timema douglasi TaxID=61478 RepID=A0A7R8ZAQ3_TIMDO|nr:unnamed protein product [Timema douglasi]